MSSQNDKGQETVQGKEVKGEVQAEKQEEPSAHNGASEEEPKKPLRKPLSGWGYCHDTSMGPYGFDF